MIEFATSNATYETSTGRCVMRNSLDVFASALSDTLYGCSYVDVFRFASKYFIFAKEYVEKIETREKPEVDELCNRIREIYESIADAERDIELGNDPTACNASIEAFEQELAEICTKLDEMRGCKHDFDCCGVYTIVDDEDVYLAGREGDVDAA